MKNPIRRRQAIATGDLNADSLKAVIAEYLVREEFGSGSVYIVQRDNLGDLIVLVADRNPKPFAMTGDSSAEEKHIAHIRIDDLDSSTVYPNDRVEITLTWLPGIDEKGYGGQFLAEIEDLVERISNAVEWQRLPDVAGPTNDPDPLIWEALTERQREVAHLIANGLTDPQIGASLTIAVGTARRHRHEIKVRVEDALGLQIERHQINQVLRDANFGTS